MPSRQAFARNIEVWVVSRSDDPVDALGTRQARGDGGELIGRIQLTNGDVFLNNRRMVVD